MSALNGSVVSSSEEQPWATPRRARRLVACLARLFPWHPAAGIGFVARVRHDVIVLTARCLDVDGRVQVESSRALKGGCDGLMRWLRAEILTPERRRRTIWNMAKVRTVGDPFVFISWSNEPSKTVAEALRDWLPNVIQAVKPWMSKTDIDAGSRWSPEIAVALSGSKFGVLCVTHENQSNPWLIFEAGALTKSLDKSHVCPYLIGGMKPSDMGNGPLTQFQAKTSDREGTLDLLKSINKSLGDASLPSDKLEKIFSVWWPELESKLSALPTPPQPKQRNTNELLVEILETVRAIPNLSYEVESLREDVDALQQAELHRGVFDGPNILGGR